MAKKIKSLPSPRTAKQYEKLIITGTKYYEKGDFAQGLRYFTRSLDFKDYHPNTLILMARCLFGLGMKNKAIKLMEHALDQNAENPAICESLGSACLSFDLPELAIQFFTLYIQLSPGEAVGYNNLATALRENGQLDESIQLLQDIIPMYPEVAILWNSIGAGVSFRDGYPAAQVFYEEAYRLDKTIPMFVSNLCMVYANLQQYEKAFEFAKKIIELAPNASYGYRALTFTSLRLAKFDDAFEAMAWHNHPSDHGSVFMPYNIEKWQGQDLKGKTILIGAEQGIGDEILFSCLYPAAIKEAKKVIIGCDKRLVTLFQNSFKDATVLHFIHGEHEAGYKVRLYEGLDVEEVDYMCLYTEFMRYRWRSLEDIPDMSDGYLTPDNEKSAYWKEKLSHLPHALNIGICWRSGLKQAKRSMYYADLEEWLPVFKTKDVNFINVQYGEVDDELKELMDKHDIVLHNFEELDLKDDFEGSAALMKNLDLVIGPATTPVTQAASTGCRSWWINYNERPWWTFGLDDSTRIFTKNKMSQKNPAMDWKEYMILFAKKEFAPWVKERLKEKSA